MDRLPNFLIIGAQKSGTTSLYHYLNRHPQIFMSPLKEPHFFTFEGQPPPNPSIITTFEEYKELFARARDEIAIGEASPSYLHSEQAPIRIAQYFPAIRMIAILRNPVERAYANYLHNVRNGREKLEFWQAVQVEEQRIKEGAGYVFWYRYKGWYHQHLMRYFRLFDRNQIRIYLFEDLKRDTRALVRDIFRFLGVDDAFQPRLGRHNVSGLPRGRLGMLYDRARKNALATTIVKRVLQESIRNRLRKRFLTRPELSEDIKTDLIEGYRDEILRLEELLQRDLSSWQQ